MKNKFIILFFILNAFGSLQANEKSWKETLAEVSSGIVSIKIDSPKAFDTLSKHSPAESSIVEPKVTNFLGLLTITNAVFPPETKRQR